MHLISYTEQFTIQREFSWGAGPKSLKIKLILVMCASKTIALLVCIIQPQSPLPDVKEAAEIKLGVPTVATMLDNL